MALLSAAELNVFISEVDEQVLRKAGLRWVLSTIGGEPLATELTEKGVHSCSMVVCSVFFTPTFTWILLECHCTSAE